MASIVRRASSQLSTKPGKPGSTRRKSIFADLAHFQLLVSNPDEVGAYLNAYPRLRPLLVDMVRKTRAEFGADAQLTLLAYRDPEIDDRYLTLYVRASTYDPNFMDRIEAISRGFHSRLARVSGHLLLTTDFAPAEPTCPSSGRPS